MFSPKYEGEGIGSAPAPCMSGMEYHPSVRYPPGVSNRSQISAVPPPPLRDGLVKQWMLKPGIDFFNHGSFGALPRAVFDAQNAWRLRLEAEPIELIGRRCEDLVREAKKPVGEWLGMNESDFGLVTNATEGVNAALQSLSLAPGDELLATSHVYNAVRQAMRHTARRAGAEYCEVKIPLPLRSPGGITETVLGALTSRTRVLVIDHVTSPTGLVFPVEQIIAGCMNRKNPVDVLVDGAHVPGMLPLNVGKLGAAYYAANLHKWVCAPKGSAFLWVRPDLQPAVHPAVISHHLGEGFSREFGWQGTRDLSSWFTIPRAMEFMAELGWERVMDHNHRMAAWAHRMLVERWKVEPISPLDGSMLGSTATVRLPDPLDGMDAAQSAALQQRLYSEFGIEVPLVWNEGWTLRVSCQVYNTAAQYERLAEVIETIARTSAKG
ncbi:MAG: Aminotransferase [Phycisphaerales bacterium]|nr:Aminotransferase [Phycisphaerales bacterium]